VNGNPDAVIRAAVAADAPAIAALHVAVSTATYRDLAPPAAVRRLDLPHRLARWRETLEKGERCVLVAEIAGRLVGIGSAGAPTVREPGRYGEVLHLYVDPDYAGRGIGRALMQALALALRAQGYKGAALGVVDGNLAAMAFYERLGGVPSGRYVDPGPIWRSQNVIYVWDDLETLIRDS
jgi:ribosomal protein S18 acetylase RimI-like enzyme